MKSLIAFLLGVAVAVGAYYGMPRFLLGNDLPAKADAVVVLAGGERGKRRLEEGLRLIREESVTNLVVSGVEFDPQNQFFDKPTWDVLRGHFGAAHLFVDPHSQMTQESARFVSELARRNGWRGVLVVTSAFHWRRARMCFRYECEPAAEVRVCTINDQRWDAWWRNSHRVGLVLREYCGLAHFFVVGSPYGLMLVGVVVVVGGTVWFARRLIP